MKNEKTNGQIIILTPFSIEKINESKGSSGTILRSGNKDLSLKEWSVDSKSIAAQLKSITEGFHEEITPETMESLGIKQIELSLTITGKGKLAILGSGIEAGANASIKLLIEPKKKK